MFLKFICKFIFIIILSNFFDNNNILTRELSIKDLELRKKADQERLLERQKRGLKKSKIEKKFTTDIVFLTKERKIPPVLSNLDPILSDEGFYGIKLGNEDNLTTGNFLGHDYQFKFIQVGLEEELEKEFKVLVDKGYKFFIVDLKTDEILNLMELEEFDEVLIFNTRSKSKCTQK